MKRIFYILLGIILGTTSVAYAVTVFRSDQIGSSPSSNYILQTNGTISSWVPNVASTTLDVFLVTGGSNAEGRGNSALSPTPPTGKVLQYYSSTISDAVDPVGAASTGSAWPSFGASYYAATGRKVIFVFATTPSSAQTAGADMGSGNWDTSGTLYGASVTTLNSALSAITTAGYTPVFRGVLSVRLAVDADAINSATITKAQYKTALTAMIARYRSTYGAGMPFYIFELGTNTTASDTGYATIRQAEEEVAGADFNTKIVFRNGADYPRRGLMSDNVHYTQAGYNEMGQVAAANISSAQAYSFFQHVSTTTPDIYFNAGNTVLGTSTPFAKLSVWGGGTGSGNAFAVANNASTSLFTVLDSGNVGIGVATPSYKLDVSSSARFGNPTYFGYPTEVGGVTNDGGVVNTFNVIGLSSKNLSLGTNGQFDKLFINTAGLVGIASTTPWGLLSVNPNALGTNVPGFVVGSSTATKFIVDSAGNVGVNTSAPTRVLSINGITEAYGTGSNAQLFSSTTDVTTGTFAAFNANSDSSRLLAASHSSARVVTRYGITLGGWTELTALNNLGTSNGLILGVQANSPIVFGTNNLERAIILGSGEMGVGSTTPWKLFSIGSNNTGTFAISTSTMGILRTSPMGEVYASSATTTKPLFNGFTTPDTGGNSWVQPSTINAPASVVGNSVYIASSTTAKTGFYGTLNIPNNFASSTSQVTIGWTATSTVGATVWNMDWRCIGGNDTTSLYQTTFQESKTVTSNNPSTAGNRVTSNININTGFYCSPSDTMQFYLYRDGSVAGDTSAVDAEIYDAVIKYPTN